MPILDYAIPTPVLHTNWPWRSLLLVTILAAILIPTDVDFFYTAPVPILFLRTLLAVGLRERSLSWIPYLAAVPFVYFCGPSLFYLFL